jgi:glycosyltransferase involved in cell wall biosynthesis
MPPGSVAILLCTLNGARFLPLQLASFEAQDFADWRVIVSDDGSQDATPALLADFQKKHGPSKVELRQGPRRGFVANFLSLICDPAIVSDYYALSDQDDIWDAGKLSRARSVLMNAPPGAPTVYCARTRLIDDEGVEFGRSNLFRRPPHFRNALVQSIAGGNTMVLNEALRQVLARAGPDLELAAHDWWIYLATTAVGGTVLYDARPTVSYRVHSRNLIGSNRTFAGHALRMRMLWNNRFRLWNDLNVRALERIEPAMTQASRKTFALFRRARKESFLPRVWGLLRSRIYRQTVLGNLGLLVGIVLKKI